MKDSCPRSLCDVVTSTLRRCSIALVVGFVTSSIGGCVNVGPAHVWSKEEVVEWCAQWAVPRSSGESFSIVYLGSDEKYDHFMARPIDYWVFIRTPKDEIDLPERFPRTRSSSGPANGYLVIPSQNFERVEEAAEPGATDNPDDAQRLREDN